MQNKFLYFPFQITPINYWVRNWNWLYLGSSFCISEVVVWSCDILSDYIWRREIGVSVTQKHCVFKPIMWYAKSRTTKSISGLWYTVCSSCKCTHSSWGFEVYQSIFKKFTLACQRSLWQNQCKISVNDWIFVVPVHKQDKNWFMFTEFTVYQTFPIRTEFNPMYGLRFFQALLCCANNANKLILKHLIGITPIWSSWFSSVKYTNGNLFDNAPHL